MDQSHGLLSTGCRRHHRGAVRVLLVVPLGQSFVVATLAWMEQPARRRRRRCLVALNLALDRVGRGFGAVIDRVPSLGSDGNEEGAISIANDIHGPVLLA